jgi:hypothetical protein
VALTQYYERLRQEALNKSQGAHGLGLTLLLRQGLTAWMHALSNIPNPQNRLLPTDPGETIETPLQAELINLLVAMVLGPKKES